jgi:hypothetical protein
MLKERAHVYIYYWDNFSVGDKPTPARQLTMRPKACWSGLTGNNSDA